MKIDMTKLVVDESRSNPMVVAEKYTDCPINEICFFMAVGGAIVGQCKHLRPDDEEAECTYDERPSENGTPQLKALLDSIKAIRASDCGAWQNECMSGLFKCSDGRAKRTELRRLLNDLYKVAGI